MCTRARISHAPDWLLPWIDTNCMQIVSHRTRCIFLKEQKLRQQRKTRVYVRIIFHFICWLNSETLTHSEICITRYYYLFFLLRFELISFCSCCCYARNWSFRRGMNRKCLIYALHCMRRMKWIMQRNIGTAAIPMKTAPSRICVFVQLNFEYSYKIFFN